MACKFYNPPVGELTEEEEFIIRFVRDHKNANKITLENYGGGKWQAGAEDDYCKVVTSRKPEALDAYHMVVLDQLQFILNNEDDTEADHRAADEALMNFVGYIGYEDVKEVYNKIGKWYS